MAFQQQKLREITLQLLYSFDIGKSNPDEMITLLMKELSVSKKSVLSALAKAEQIVARQKEIDALISQTSLSYNFERIQNVEKNILRLAIFEMLFDDTIPPKVAIAEAMRLARKFSTPESASFINAILDHILQERSGKTVNRKAVESTVDAMIKSEKIAREAAESSEKTNNESDDVDEEE